MTSSRYRIKPGAFAIYQAILMLFCGAIFFFCGPSDGAADGKGYSPTGPYKAYGLNFGPYVAGQYPTSGSVVSEEQLKERLATIAPHTVWIRTYGSTKGLEHTGRIAHELGLRTAIGAWLERNPQANESEMRNLIKAAKEGQVDLAIVGSETLLREDLSEDQLVGYVNRFRAEVPGVPVTTADAYGKLLGHPAVIEACDLIMANYHPYWDGIEVAQAVKAFHGLHALVVDGARGKQVLVSECGWPSNGDQQRLAVPSPENAAFFFLNFVSWARDSDVGYFYFAAFDEYWKASYEGPQGAHWGVWDKDGNLKAGMEAVFDGKTMPDNWSRRDIPGGPGEPAIEFVFVPPYGSSEDLRGRMWHVDASLHFVAVYIYVGGGWWSKPTFATPLTVIHPDGKWICEIKTGVMDEQAEKIAAFLIPASYRPPLASGDATLPAELNRKAVAKVERTR